MSLVANDYRPEQKEKRRLTFFGNGIALDSQLLPTGDSGVLNYRAQIPANLARRVSIDLITLGSEAIGKSPLGDELGVHLQSLQVSVGGQTLPIPKYLAIPPIPTADPKMMWAWFYEPAHAQFDFYWWYLYFTGLDDAQVFAIVAVFNLVGIAGLVLSAPTLVRALTEQRSMLSSPQAIPVMDAA
jgi:hypothetical protein